VVGVPLTSVALLLQHSPPCCRGGDRLSTTDQIQHCSSSVRMRSRQMAAHSRLAAGQYIAAGKQKSGGTSRESQPEVHRSHETAPLHMVHESGAY
jgi:hypothetical protein